jgi:hypothetical protein
MSGDSHQNFQRRNKMNTVIKTVPKDTEISTYFKYAGKVFESMRLPDGRTMVRLIHTWPDGDEIGSGFEFEDGIKRTGINPLHIVVIYYPNAIDSRILKKIIDAFLNNYEGIAPSNQMGPS